jgi:hypothetical protein
MEVLCRRMVYISQEYESLASLSQSWAGRKLPGSSSTSSSAFQDALIVGMFVTEEGVQCIHVIVLFTVL